MLDRHPLTSKYAQLELERRFLLSALPADVARPIRITDRYINGTQLRLRKIEVLEGVAAPLFKLAQKVRPAPDDPRRVSLTNMYINADEYELLAIHPADVLVKTRYALQLPDRSVSVNAFEGPLTGLFLLEADFGSEEEMAAFSPPEFVAREVSLDDRFSGGRLAKTAATELRDLLKG